MGNADAEGTDECRFGLPGMNPKAACRFVPHIVKLPIPVHEANEP
jgi:hypothetical protein